MPTLGQITAISSELVRFRYSNANFMTSNRYFIRASAVVDKVMPTVAQETDTVSELVLF